MTHSDALSDAVKAVEAQEAWGSIDRRSEALRHAVEALRDVKADCDTHTGQIAAMEKRLAVAEAIIARLPPGMLQPPK